MSNPDQVVRALADDGSFRVIVARTGDTVAGVLDMQSAKNSTAQYLAELVTGAILVRETMAPAYRVQTILKGGAEMGSLVADAHPDGMTRGLISRSDHDGAFALGDDAMLQVVRTMKNGSLQQGVVSARAESGIPGALMEYMQSSEQVVSVVDVCAVLEDGKVVGAGGFIVQVLPEVGVETLAPMIERLEAFDQLEPTVRDSGGDPDSILAAIMGDVAYTRVEESSVSSGCNCSRVRVMSALASLGQAEIQALIAEERMLDMSCDYCCTHYQVASAELRGLVQDS